MLRALFRKIKQYECDFILILTEVPKIRINHLVIFNLSMNKYL